MTPPTSFDRTCTCRCGSCLTHDHEHCINPSHAAAYRQWASPVPFDTGGAADIGSFNVTPAWEKPCPLREEPILTTLGYSAGCQCGMCRAARAGHL